MGAYLSEPITKKVSSDESGTSVAFGASSMQGWRVSQEDAHNCCIDFDENTSLFAVYDGHGGHEVATYCAKELPRFIKNTEAYKAGNIKQALIDAFLGFDKTLTKPNIIAILKKIAGANENEEEKMSCCDSDEEDNVSALRKEAAMPLEQVIAKYQRSEPSDFQTNDVNEEADEKGIGLPSPYLRCRKYREKSLSSSSSSSSFSWKADRQGASSSIHQPCTSSTTSSVVDDSCAAASSREKNLDTGTSNGAIERTEPQAEPATTIKPSNDIPDSSTEDVKGEEVEVAGSSEPLRDDVSSSATTETLENGQIQQESAVRRRITPTQVTDGHCYENLFHVGPCNKCRHPKDDPPASDKPNDGDEEEDEDEDEDEDDDYSEEKDETFDALHPSSDDDAQDPEDGNDEENHSSSTSSSTSEIEENENLKKQHDCDDEEDDEDEDDEEEDDDDNEGGDFSMDMTEEPGSDSGCTAVVAILHSRDLYVANAGDSRCVLCRDGEALELSLDHKPEDQPELDRIVKAGGKVTGDGRVNGGLNLSRALGDHAYKQNTTLPAQEQMISALPDIRHVTLEPGRDKFMILACDGIWNFASSQEVVNFVQRRLDNLKTSNISSICEELFDHCLAPDTFGDGTGCDNMTAVIVKFNWNDSSNDRSTTDNPVPSIVSGHASLAIKRPVSPANTCTDDPSSANNRESSSNANTADKHNSNDRDCASSASSNDSTNNSCKRPKTDTV